MPRHRAPAVPRAACVPFAAASPPLVLRHSLRHELRACTDLFLLLLPCGGSRAQSVCVLGYCIFPLNIASVICLVGGHFFWRILVVAVCFFWSTGASLGFMGELVPPNRKALAVYPLFLFYTAIGWLILIAAKRQ